MPGPTIQDVLDRIDALDAKLSGIGVRQECFTTGDNSGAQILDDYWECQVFTISNVETHKVTSVKLKMYKKSSPGIVTASIRAVGGDGKPTGSDLCSGTIDGNILTSDIPGKWYNIPFSSGILLTRNEQYAVVVRALGGDSSNYIRWRKNSNGGYIGGSRGISSDGGNSWTLYSDDMMFEECSSPGLGDVYSLLDDGDVEVYTESQHARPG